MPGGRRGGACLKALVRPEDLIVANARFESTTWTATAIGPPLGGIAIGLFGPVTTVVIDAVSYLFSAAAIRAIGGSEPHPARSDASRLRAGDLLEGWRTILTNPALRPLFFNTILVNGLIMATAPLIAVLMLGRLGFTPWQYGLAFGAPCIGGLIGSRLARPLVARVGQHKVMLTAGALRACWPLGLAFIQAPSGSFSSLLSSLASSPAWACSIRYSSAIGSTRPRRTASPARCPRGRSPATPASRP
jgi:hypothetical protein